MDRTIKTQWVEALRGGRYKQGRKCLRSEGNCYCCLGVLADVCNCEWEWNESLNRFSAHAGLISSSGLLPDNLRETVGLPYDKMCELAKMNDDGGKTFDEIADYIEENL